MARTAPRFLALLRGLNVGGQNVLFRSGETGLGALTRAIEERLSERLSNPVQAVVFTRARYRAAVAAAPETWGRNDDRKHNALFPLRGATPQRVVKQLPVPKPDIEALATGPGVIFWSLSKQHQNRTTWMKLAAAPVYRHVTVRNHRTSSGCAISSTSCSRPPRRSGRQAVASQIAAASRGPAAGSYPWSRVRCLSARTRLTSSRSGRCRTRWRTTIDIRQGNS